jgi:hypothetical protein
MKKCEICGKVIPKERLMALPETNRCVECARTKGTDLKGKVINIGIDKDTYMDLLEAVRS